MSAAMAADTMDTAVWREDEAQVIPHPSSPPSVPRVIAANISRGSLSTATAAGFLALQHEQLISTIMFVESGPYLDDGRNKAVANAFALNPPLDTWEWILFIDSDIEFAPSDVTTLFDPYECGLDPIQHPIIGGVYVNPFPGDGHIPGELPEESQVGPVVYEFIERDDLYGDLQGVPTKAFRRLSRSALASLPPISPDHPTVAECRAIGTGFMAIHRSLLELMLANNGHPLPWFHEPVVNGIHLGEDLGFCYRSWQMGYPVLVNRACTLIHHKTVKLI